MLSGLESTRSSLLLRSALNPSSQLLARAVRVTSLPTDGSCTHFELPFLSVCLLPRAFREVFLQCITALRDCLSVASSGAAIFVFVCAFPFSDNPFREFQSCVDENSVIMILRLR